MAIGSTNRVSDIKAEWLPEWLSQFSAVRISDWRTNIGADGLS